jgi:tRNA nucleotidyltransferase (CCA-adding enzyme)
VGLPRRESKIGLGHRGFAVNSDPFMPLAEAAARRDFTINAVYLDPLTDDIEDPWGGLADLTRRRLRHTSAAFADDPLRVLRGMQLAARFDLEPDTSTIQLCRRIEPEGLAVERIFAEWCKLILLGKVPARGLAFLNDSGWVRYFPELAALIGVSQDESFHPEGDVWSHTCEAMNVFASERLGDEKEDLIVGLAVLCHDFGKPATTQHKDGRIRSPGHAGVSVDATRNFLARLTASRDLVEAVIPLVREHGQPQALFEAGASDAAVRRLARRVGRIDRLLRVARADRLGRPPLHKTGFPAGEWLLERARKLSVETAPPPRLILGRHLIEMGLQPGPGFGAILDACYAAQLDGRITTLAEGLAFVRAWRKNGDEDPES